MPEESAGSRFQQKPGVIEQRHNKHQQQSPRDQQKTPITETTSADARRDIKKDKIETIGQKSQENEGITEIKSYGDFMETLSKTPSISDQQLAHL